MSVHYLGIDVGGTKTEICLVKLKDASLFQSHEVIARKRMETLRFGTLESFLDRLKSLISETLAQENLPIHSLKGMGIGLPGSIDPKTQVMGQGSMPFFKNIPLNKIFKDHLGYKGALTLDNDANCFALAEAYLGAGAQWASKNKIPLDELCMIGITLGTGLGGGLIIRGELIRGSRGGAGEIGHMTLVESGPLCYCGKYGCSEQYLSGTAFELAYAARTKRKEINASKEIFKLVDERDPSAIATLEHYRDLLVRFLSNLSNGFDPHLFVLGGGMSTQAKIYTDLEQRLSENCFLSSKPPAILQNRAGDSAGVLGAALLSFSKGHS